MDAKPRKIKDIEFDGEHLHVDIRISLPVSAMSPEFIKDVFESRTNLINGAFAPHSNDIWLEWRVSVTEQEDGTDALSFSKQAKELKTFEKV